ncbi:hypothetical protein Acsp02_88750 [Actinoplanes sp. NBRC 103695]|nr:hypothetical protein Acsp02_88750 [Actinoplanes sp. NBRC 103695]
MSLLPFDRSDPPHTPPDGCDDPLKWAMAHRLFQDHRANGDGACLTCVPVKLVPCHGRDLALRGFLSSLGLDDLVLPTKAN